MIADALIRYALAGASGRKVRDLRAGVSYTGVLLDDHACGLAYTFRNELGSYCGIIRDAGQLIGKECEEIIPWLKSENRLKAAIGLAAVNAVVNRVGMNCQQGNVTGALSITPSDHFGMVGAFQPILKEVRRKTGRIFVFDQDLSKKGHPRAESRIPEDLPKCDVVVVTATSLINHTVDEVLAECHAARQTCLVGPSTPLCPQAFKGYPVTLLAGVLVTNPGLALEIISQGGGTGALKQATKSVLVEVDGSF